MKTDPRTIPDPAVWTRSRPEFFTTLQDAGLDDLDALSARSLGEVVTEHRSSWVRSVTIGPTKVYVKTYDYSTPADRRRGWFRTTWLAPSRADREWRALEWLQERGFVAPDPLLVGESRHFGVLRRAVLVTEAWDGISADRELERLPKPDKGQLVAAIRVQVRRWHEAGFRDRNLDLRNILVRRDQDGWVVTKVDSPRHRIVRPGRRDDRLARADWQRLDADFTRLGLGSEIGR